MWEKSSACRRWPVCCRRATPRRTSRARWRRSSASPTWSSRWTTAAPTTRRRSSTGTRSSRRCCGTRAVAATPAGTTSRTGTSSSPPPSSSRPTGCSSSTPTSASPPTTPRPCAASWPATPWPAARTGSGATGSGGRTATTPSPTWCTGSLPRCRATPGRGRPALRPRAHRHPPRRLGADHAAHPASRRRHATTGRPAAAQVPRGRPRRALPRRLRRTRPGRARDGPVDRPACRAAGAGRVRGGSRADLRRRAGARLVALVPARNAAADLPGWLEWRRRSPMSWSRSTTAAPTTPRASSRPARSCSACSPTPGGRATRLGRPRQPRRLLDAAAEVGARLAAVPRCRRAHRTADDAAALRDFVAREADRDAAYGFRVYRMRATSSTTTPPSSGSDRLFPRRPGLSCRRSVCTSCRSHRASRATHWQRTTVRIQHLSGLTDDRRRARLREVPRRRPRPRLPGRLRRTCGRRRPRRERGPRPAGLPVLADPLTRGRPSTSSCWTPGPRRCPPWSSRATTRPHRARGAVVVAQECPEPFEVIVVTSGEDRTAAIVRERFPARDARRAPAAGASGRGPQRRPRRGPGRGRHLPGVPHRVAPREPWPHGCTRPRGGAPDGDRRPCTTAPTRRRAGRRTTSTTPRLPGRPSGPLSRTPGTCSYRGIWCSRLAASPRTCAPARTPSSTSSCGAGAQA